MENCKEVSTRTAPNFYMDSDEVGQSINATKCRGLIGSLIYPTTSRPDI